MSQLFVVNKPLNVIISGYDNDVNNNNSIIVGNKNTNTKLSIINGDNNYLTGEGVKLINGSNNQSNNASFINGDQNVSYGNVFLSGNLNTTNGQNIFILGNNNTSYSYFTNNYVYLTGKDNLVNGESLWVFGNTNIVNDGYGNYILGSNNQIQGGWIENNTGSTASDVNPELPIQSNNTKIYLNGDYNIVATYSNNLTVYGSYNAISSSASNTFVISNSASITEPNQVYIGPDKDVNIKGKVLPTSLVQDYTPTQQDQTGESGWVTKDDSNLYVKTTNLGWRQIPFDDTYASFYDTTNQTNPTASIAKAFTFNNTVVNSNISLVNSSKITVNYDGLYNIQFSAQVNKSGGGKNDIDIWLRYNGVDVPDSNTQVTVIGNNGKAVPAWNFFQSMTASSHIELMWSSADTGMSIYSAGTQSNPDRPAVPSIILTINKLASL